MTSSQTSKMMENGTWCIWIHLLLIKATQIISSSCTLSCCYTVTKAGSVYLLDKNISYDMVAGSSGLFWRNWLFYVAALITCDSSAQSFVTSTTFGVRPGKSLQPRSHVASVRLQMAIEPLVSLLLSADAALSPRCANVQWCDCCECTICILQ